jgi:Na+/H+-dicarboxylate symporter
MEHDRAAAALPHARGIWGWWVATPLYLRILGALAVGVLAGVALGDAAGLLAQPARLILRIAPPLILFAMIRALSSAELPRSLLGPLTDTGSVIGVIIIALALGLALRRLREHPVRNVRDLVDVGFQVPIVVLRWIIEIIPFGNKRSEALGST